VETTKGGGIIKRHTLGAVAAAAAAAALLGLLSGNAQSTAERIITLKENEHDARFAAVDHPRRSSSRVSLGASSHCRPANGAAAVALAPSTAAARRSRPRRSSRGLHGNATRWSACPTGDHHPRHLPGKRPNDHTGRHRRYRRLRRRDRHDGQPPRRRRRRGCHPASMSRRKAGGRYGGCPQARADQV
jgi:hypothetical protein